MRSAFRRTRRRGSARDRVRCVHRCEAVSEHRRATECTRPRRNLGTDEFGGPGMEYEAGRRGCIGTGQARCVPFGRSASCSSRILCRGFSSSEPEPDRVKEKLCEQAAKPRLPRAFERSSPILLSGDHRDSMMSSAQRTRRRRSSRSMATMTARASARSGMSPTTTATSSSLLRRTALSRSGQTFADGLDTALELWHGRHEALGR